MKLKVKLNYKAYWCESKRSSKREKVRIEHSSRFDTSYIDLNVIGICDTCGQLGYKDLDETDPNSNIILHPEELDMDIPVFPKW